MLHEFLVTHRAELIRRAQTKAADRFTPAGAEGQASRHGVPIFLNQLVESLKIEEAGRPGPTEDIGTSARMHGEELLKLGFTVEQVVHDYGDVCQAVTELAMAQGIDLTTEEFHTFNRCLDDAIAAAVTEYSRGQAAAVASGEVERLGFLAHELRNLLSSATLSFELLQRGTVGIAGKTGNLHARTLASLGVVIERTLAEVRLTAHVVREERLRVADLLDDVAGTAAAIARARGLQLTIGPVDQDAFVLGDRQILGSAVANLLQNAIKFTREGGSIRLETKADGARVRIEIADECGGLPAGLAETLGRPFQQEGNDRSGLGLGLAIVRRSVHASHGTLSVIDRPEAGCTFTIDLPQSTGTKR